MCISPVTLHCFPDRGLKALTEIQAVLTGILAKQQLAKDNLSQKLGSVEELLSVHEAV